MKKYVIGFMHDGFPFYLGYSLTTTELTWGAFRGIELAKRFKTLEEAKKSLHDYLLQRYVGDVFVHEITYLHMGEYD